MLKDLTIKEMLLTNHNNPGYDLLQMMGVVMHWTANTDKGADAVMNANYFNTTDISASAHYIVDDHQIVRCIPNNKVAWHCGANSYSWAGKLLQKTIDGRFYSPNFFTIGIEMAVNSDGDWNKTYANSVLLAACLLLEYKLTTDNLYRHFDITGKICPAMMVDNSPSVCPAWAKFKTDVAAKMKELTTLAPQPIPTPKKEDMNMVGPFVDVPDTLSQGMKDLIVYAYDHGLVSGSLANDGNPNHRILGYGQAMNSERVVCLIAAVHKQIMADVQKMLGK